MSSITVKEMKSYLTEAREEIDKAEWEKNADAPAGCDAYIGKTETHRFVVVAYPSESGGMGFDGTVAVGTLVVRLTRDLAKLAVEVAQKKLGSEKK